MGDVLRGRIEEREIIAEVIGVQAMPLNSAMKEDVVPRCGSFGRSEVDH